MATRWTVFWKNLGIKTVKRNRTLKSYNVRADIQALRRIGVYQDVAEDIYRQTGVFNDPLFFHHLSLFFRQDAEATMTWLSAPSKTEAFKQLFQHIDLNNLKRTKQKLSEISFLLKYYKKGEGWHFECPSPNIQPQTFHPKALLMSLNKMDGKAKYRFLGSTILGNDHIYAIEKEGANGPSVYKFIKLSFSADRVSLALSMDSTKEYYKSKKAVERALGLYFESPQEKKSLKKFELFLLSGNSAHFVLTGATYFEDAFKVSVSPIHNRVGNVAGASTFKRKLKATAKKTETISVVRLFHTKKGLSKPISVNILSYRTAGIIGAIQFVPNDRNLSEARRKKFKADFARDFGISLNAYVSYNDLDEMGIYRILLEGTPQKIPHIDLRSERALFIYKEFVNDKLLQPNSTTEEQARFCINKNCADRNRIVWERKICAACGDPLIFGRRLYTRTISEENVVNYLRSALPAGTVTKLSNKLINRELFVAKIENGENVAEFIPLSTHLLDHQLEVLKFRYPDLVIITSLDNWEHYDSMGFRTIRLYELVQNIKRGGSTLVYDILAQANAAHLEHSRTLCRDSISRLTDSSFYKGKNQISKYLGAEFFEADCSALLNYVFGNCLWLGAKYRGTSVPDGFTAFPLLRSRNGCFIWDSKYGEGKTLQMGEYKKNKTYIDAARKTPSIRENGGLKGFAFISNKSFPKRFEKKYRPLVKNSRIKMIFLSATQLKKIAEQFRRHESLIFNNENARSVFIESMRKIFFIVKDSQNPKIIQDQDVDDILTKNQDAFRKARAGRRLQVKK